LSESLGVVSDLVAKAVRRNVPVSEPLISVGDAVQRGLFLSREMLEPPILVTDTPDIANIKFAVIFESLGIIGEFIKSEVNPPEVMVLWLLEEIRKLKVKRAGFKV